MARKSIRSNYYIFDASARQVVIPGGVQREQLILITNVTDNKVIYNFSDPELTASAYSIETDIRNVTTTRITLTYNTTSMSDTDKLQIVYDDFEETIKPAETYHDAVNKAKISEPQSQIDTDFEYGTQSTKWESLAMINNNPFAYKSDEVLAINDIQAVSGSKKITVTVDTGQTARPPAGTAVFIQDTNFPGANGVFIIDKTTGSNDFEYTAKYEWTAGSGAIINPARTAVYTGIHFTGSDIGGSITISAPGDGSIRIDTTSAHGLEVGNEIAVAGSNGTNVNGSWVVARVESPTRFYYFPDGNPSGSIDNGTKKLYPRPQGSSIHRAFDGGVKFSTNTFSKNQQAIRQTKRYFRYQSGKGVAFSTGSILAPSIENIDNISSSGTTITVVAAVAHNITRDTVIDVRGCNDNHYNGQYGVTNVIDAYKFEYEVPIAPNETVASGLYSVTPINSYGTRLDIGMMDQQNGIFFRYANGHLGVVRRSSTAQLSGRVTVTAGNTLVTSYTSENGEGTKFGKQLEVGDYVVIRGSSYRVDGIISDTQMVIFPDYRGPSAVNVPVTKTVEVEWKQAAWNLDRMDGTGKSGYTLDVTKMQMFYMDYSWYGAGFIRWGFRAEDGNIIYVHKIPNNNANTEAYMRSGNLPARYEVNTIPPKLSISKSIGTADSVIYTDKAPLEFPDTGTLRLKQSTAATAGVVEYVNYTGVTRFYQDVIEANGPGNYLVVADTTGLQPGGVQTITFTDPFSNITANKIYYVASVPNTTNFTITDTPGSSTPISLTQATGNVLSPLSIAQSGRFTGLTREQAGTSNVNLTMGLGSSSGSVSNGTGIQKGQVVVGAGIPDDTFVHSISGTSIALSKAVTSSNPTSVRFVPMGAASAQSFSYSDTRPIGVELVRATSVPQISHWGSSVIMDGRYDDDRAYVYTVGTRTGRTISSGQTKAILALRIAPSVDNGIPGSFATRELTNRMQLVLRGAEIAANGPFFVELLLNPTVDTAATWQNVGGTSLAQYAVLNDAAETQDGEVIFGFFVDAGVASYDLSDVKEISNSILGGGIDQFIAKSGANPTGIFPDGPEVLVVRVTNIAGGRGSQNRSADARFSWTEAQA